jgi:hypothetical protein
MEPKTPAAAGCGQNLGPVPQHWRGNPAARGRRTCRRRAPWRLDLRPGGRRASRSQGPNVILASPRLARRPRLEVADIFRRHGEAWRPANAGPVSLAQRRVMTAIEICRTAALGGHVERCQDCAHTRVALQESALPKMPVVRCIGMACGARSRASAGAVFCAGRGAATAGAVCAAMPEELTC